MPEEKIVTEPTETPEETKTVSIEELAAQLDQIKKAQAGSDKAYQEAAKKAKELETENEKLKKEKMSEKERAEFEFAKQKAELEAKSREVADATLRLAKIRHMGDKGVPLEYADYITGSNDDEILNSIETFNKRIDSLVGKKVEEKLLSGEKPKAGTEAKAEEIPKDWKAYERQLRSR